VNDELSFLLLCQCSITSIDYGKDSVEHGSHWQLLLHDMIWLKCQQNKEAAKTPFWQHDSG